MEDINKYLTVSSLNNYIKYKFDNDIHLMNVLLKGEISNFKKHSRGHLYFTIKDDSSQISAVMFSSNALKLKFNPKDGMKILVEGKISVYVQTGNYQIYVDKITQDGLGDLYLAYEELKKNLEKEGLFDASHKLPLPKFPNTIGVITSETGAVIKDIINTVRRRYPLSKILLYPSLVQGDGAKESIVKMIEKANLEKKADVLIIGRGGGSIEDLWCFNEKEVAYAIFNSKIPTISAVGHETDFTIADFVSSMRAPTPTAAAELATPSIIDLKDLVIKYYKEINKKTKTIFENNKTRLVHIDQLLDSYGPITKLKSYNDLLNKQTSLLNSNVLNILEFNKLKYSNASQKIYSFDLINLINQKYDSIKRTEINLEKEYIKIISNKKYLFSVLLEKTKALNPLLIMEKGFSVVKNSKNEIIKDETDVSNNELISIKLYKGNINAIVKK